MKRITRLWTYLSLLAVLGFGPAAAAQTGKGSITGTIKDSSGSLLQGAEVELQPGTITVVSNQQGSYYLNDLPPGTYTITVTYLGFALYTKVVNIAAEQLTTQDVTMGVSSQRDQVIVTAPRVSGEAEALNRQLTADNTVQVLTNDVITSLPNANMADALGRLPSVTLERDEGEGKYVQVRGTEPRLTNATIDGVNVPSPESGIRQIKFDTIPADLVESVEINKTLQANMDGDGIGGSVNMITKTAGERPTVAINGIGGYTPIVNGRGVVETTATLGQRFGSEKRLGILVGGSYDWNGRGIDDIEPVSDLATFPNGQQAVWKDGMDIREYRYYRSRWGTAGSVDYKLSEASNVYARFLYSDFKNFGERWVYSLNDNTPGITLLGSNGGTPSFNTSIRRPDYAIGSLVVGGKHVFTTTWYSWDISASRSRQIENGDPEALFSSDLASSNCQFDPAATKSIYRPQWSSACYTEAYDPTTMLLSRITYSHGRTAQVNLQATGAFAKRYHIGSRLASIEVGGKFRNAHKYDDSINYTLTPLDAVGAIPQSTFPSKFTNKNYYGGSYPLGYNISYNDVYAFYATNLANTSHFLSPNDPSAQDFSSQFDLVEKVSAGYVMNSVDIGKARIVAGLRIEGTNLDTIAVDLTATPPVLNVKNSGSYIKVLPSASLRYDMGNDTYVRLSYARGLSRPDPQDIAQAVTYIQPTGGAPGSATIANPGLNAETADNFDLSVEHYLKPFGVITAGFFYKNLYDPIAQETFLKSGYSPAPGIAPGLYQVTQFVNAGSAWLYGFEVAYVQHYTFLPGLLRGFGLGANYGYADSRAIGLPGRSDSPRLLRSAPNTWNISPTYDLGRLSFRAGLSYNDANIFSYGYQDGTGGSTPTPGGLKGPFSDTYFYPHLQIDMQGSVRLAHGLTFIAYILNVNNEVFGFYQGSPQYMIQREYYQPTYAAGFRWSPSFEH
jgi:TonB-dependent receptor